MDGGLPIPEEERRNLQTSLLLILPLLLNHHLLSQAPLQFLPEPTLNSCTLLLVRSVFLLLSLRSQDKLVSLEAFLEEYNIHVLIGTETWLTSDINNSEIFPNQKYAIYRKDRTEGKGGGVLIAVRNDLNSSSVQIQSDNDSSEQVWCSLQIPNKFRLYICSFYRPPNSDEAPLLSLYDSLQNVITGESGSRDRKVFVSGDFNLPEIDWNAISLEDCDHSMYCFV